MVGAQGIDSDTRNDRRIDAARQTNDHIGELVLVHVVACAEHQCLIHLGNRVEQWRNANRRLMKLSNGLVADEHGWQQRVGHPTARIEQALAEYRRNVDVGDHQFFFELSSARQQIAVGIERH